VRDALKHERKLRWQREQRARTKNRCTKKYEKTPNGFLMRVYRNMLSRVRGIQPRNRELYVGFPILPKEQFYDWALSDSQFVQLFSVWEASRFDRRLTPSIDRINPDRGYESDNIRWLTHSENSSLGASK